MNRKIETLAFVLTCCAVLYLYREFLDETQRRFASDSEKMRDLLLDIRSLLTEKKSDKPNPNQESLHVDT